MQGLLKLPNVVPTAHPNPEIYTATFYSHLVNGAFIGTFWATSLQPQQHVMIN